MIRLLDGPVAGNALLLKRAPVYLRVVVSPSGKVDALDQLDDTPAPRETIHVYRRDPDVEPVWIHVSMHPRSRSGFFWMAEYSFVGDVDGEAVRATEDWRTWVLAQTPCPDCAGYGWVVGETLGCCGDFLPSGECCSAVYGTDRLVPEQVQEQCAQWFGTGRLGEAVAS